MLLLSLCRPLSPIRRFLDATDLLFANTGARDRPEGLRQLQELSRLVEQALAAAAQAVRGRMRHSRRA